MYIFAPVTHLHLHNYALRQLRDVMRGSAIYVDVIAWQRVSAVAW